MGDSDTFNGFDHLSILLTTNYLVHKFVLQMDVKVFVIIITSIFIITMLILFTVNYCYVLSSIWDYIGHFT